MGLWTLGKRRCRSCTRVSSAFATTDFSSKF